jgi:hypothetical protein
MRKHDEMTQAQVATAQYLLYQFCCVDPKKYVATENLRSHLLDLGFAMGKRMLRSQVIGTLRDRGVFIVSSSKGIKIPFNVADIGRFVKQVDNEVLPYLNRLQLLRAHFLLASERRLEIVDPLRFPKLHALVRDRRQ